MDFIYDWCVKWGFKISINKSCAVIFSRNRKQSQELKSITINGEPLKYEKEVKFLGVIFDNQLTWRSHVEYVNKKCLQRLHLMRSFAGTSWGANKKCQLTIYRVLIRSVIDYGAIAYDSAAKTHKKLIQSIQNKALKICTGAMRGTSADALQVECGEAPLQVRRMRQQLEYALKILSDKDHINCHLLEDHWTHHWGKYKAGEEPWILKIKNILDKLDIQSQRKKRKWTSPPWNLELVERDTSLKGIENRANPSPMV